MLFGLIAAAACALASTVAAVLKWRGAQSAPAVSFKTPLSSAGGLLNNRSFLAGVLLATVATLCNAAAITLAPISVVKPVAAASLITLGVVVSLMLGIKVTGRQQLGLVLVAAGLAGIVLTAQGHSTGGSGQALLIFEAVALSCGLLLVGIAKLKSSALVLALAAGILGGSADALIKHLPQSSLEGAIASGLLLLALAAIGLLLAAKALQGGQALAVIAALAVSANLTSIASGFIVFGEKLPSSTLAISVQLLALVLIFAALALMPPSIAN